MTFMIHNWMRMLLAILLGNLFYFATEPWLPDAVQHGRFQLDAGLILNMGICVGTYLLLRKWK